MENTLIGFETAKLAKLKGFVGKWCTTYYKVDGVVGYIAYYEYYDNNEDDNPMVFDKVKPLCEAPTQSLLQKYLRDKHNIIIIVNYQHSVLKHKSYYFNTIIKNNVEFEDTQERFGKILDKSYQNISGNYVNEELLEKYLFEDKFAFDTYEECLEYALQQALNLI